MNLFPMKCPRCNHAYVHVNYVDTLGAHWICPFCKLNSDSYSAVITDNKTTLIKMEKDNE